MLLRNKGYFEWTKGLHVIVHTRTAVQRYISSDKPSKILSKWLEYKIIPISRSMFFNHVRYFREHGVYLKQWVIQRGAKPIIKLDKVCDMLVSDSSGWVLSIKKIQAHLSEELRITDEKSGLAVATVSDDTRKTARNYKYLVALINNVTTSVKVSKKPGTRYTAENSLMSTICYLMVVTSTHFLSVNLTNYITRRKLVKQVIAVLD